MIIDRCRIQLLTTDGNLIVAVEQDAHDAPLFLDAERKRKHIEQLLVVICLALQLSRQHGGAPSDCLIRIDAFVKLLAVEELHQHLLDHRDSGRAADENDLVDFVLCDLGIGKDSVDAFDAFFKLGFAKRFKLFAGYGDVEVLTIS